jgi:hypothetical protein
LESVPEKVSAATSASLSDYALILYVLSAIHEEVPTRGLLVGLPMLMALHGSTEVEDGANEASKQRVKAIHELLARVWLVLGRVWECTELVDLAEKVSHSVYSLLFSERLLINEIRLCQQWKRHQHCLLSLNSFLVSYDQHRQKLGSPL